MTAKVEADGLLHVRLERRVVRDRALDFAPEYHALLREWGIRAASASARAIKVRAGR